MKVEDYIFVIVELGIWVRIYQDLSFFFCQLRYGKGWLRNKEVTEVADVAVHFGGVRTLVMMSSLDLLLFFLFCARELIVAIID